MLAYSCLQEITSKFQQQLQAKLEDAKGFIQASVLPKRIE